MKAAALEFLSKPINDEDLLDAIQQAIARDHRVDEDSWVDDRARVDILRPYRFDHLLAQDQKRRQKASDSLPASVILPCSTARRIPMPSSCFSTGFSLGKRKPRSRR